jgi:hypothetical protein
MVLVTHAADGLTARRSELKFSRDNIQRCAIAVRLMSSDKYHFGKIYRRLNISGY